MTSTRTLYAPTVGKRELRRVAFVDMLAAPNNTYGNPRRLFVLRDRTGADVAVIDGEYRYSTSSSVAGDVEALLGRARGSVRTGLYVEVSAGEYRSRLKAAEDGGILTTRHLPYA